jgi:hypothetical protein
MQRARARMFAQQLADWPEWRQHIRRGRFANSHRFTPSFLHLFKFIA